MSDRLVTVATFSTDLDAHLARSKLEACGIPCYLKNEAFAGVNGGIGPVDLQVLETRADAASSVLSHEASPAPGRSDPPSAPAEEDTPRCLVCQSSLVAFREPPLLLRIVRGLVLQVVPLPPQWFESRRRACGVCGHEWQEEP